VRQGTRIGLDYTMTVTEMTESLDAVLLRGNAERTPSGSFPLGGFPEVACSDVRSFVTLYDPQGYVPTWKARLEPFPTLFRLNIFHQCIFDARFRLKDMRRASELSDMPLFHAAISEFTVCVFRLLFALNRSWFGGIKHAHRSLARLPLMPSDCAKRIGEIVRHELHEEVLRDLHSRARSLLADIARIVAEQGADEKERVEWGTSYWPDVDTWEW
jgi:hypothetical protein